jgi:predicted nuclease with RNAse H fold
MLELKGKCAIGIVLAGSSKNPSGCALLKDGAVKTCLVHTETEILENVVRNRPARISIDASLSLPKKGEPFREADREMIKKWYRVFPQIFPL